MGMNAIFGLLENYGMGRVDDRVRDFLSTVSGEAMHKNVVRFGVADQEIVDLVCLKNLPPLGSLRF